jgi:aminoglycoside phosphotransferase (APT) family kinase protein
VTAETVEADDRLHLESDPSPDGLARMGDALAPLAGDGVPGEIIRLGGGLDCATHRFTLGGRRLVVKRSKPGATTAPQEFENLHFASRSTVGTPEPIALDAGGEWFGTPAVVMGWIDGGPNLRPRDDSVWLRELAAALAAVHDTPTDGIPIRRPPLWARWEPRAGSDDDHLWARMARAVDDLREVADSERGCFTHQDFHPGNVVWRGDRVAGVVDWLYASVEPRQAAVAYCRKDLAIHPGGDAADRFLRAYEAEVGERLDHMALWDVLYGSKAMEWGHLWAPSFAEVGVALTPRGIHEASVAFVAGALGRAGR